MILKRIPYLLLIYFLSLQFLEGQPAPTGGSTQLDKLFVQLLKETDDSVRLQINDSIRTIVESYAESDSVFIHRFSNLKFLGQVTSPDTLIKIITWNLLLRNQPGRYYCYIIRNLPELKSRKVYKLYNEYDTTVIDKEKIYKTDNWYGALYYDLRPQIINGTNCWVLLGIDYGNPEITRKLIEILSFGKDDSIILGVKSFLSDNSMKFREVFEYSLTATMTLRFGGDDSIIFDHLVSFSPDNENDRRFFGPHYSNDAYILENGFWKLHLNIDARNKEILKPQ
ncbi:MAG: hypothetical protein IPN68_02340 [Bacteroidetes bacterium]|nr:hypothetical protein [Bacteroidota bacterium]